MSILHRLIVTEELGIGASTGIGAGIGGVVGGVGGHLYGKFKTRKMTDKDARKKEVSKYRNYGLLAGAGIGAAAGMYKAGAAKLKKSNASLASTQKNLADTQKNLAATNANLANTQQELAAAKDSVVDSNRMQRYYKELAKGSKANWDQYNMDIQNLPEFQYQKT